MDLLTAVVIGVIQGVLEWLPVSSEAVISLVMTQLLGSGTIESVNTAVFLHLGTAIAATIYFREDYTELLKDGLGLARQRKAPDNLFVFVTVATVVTGGLGFFSYLFVREMIPESPSLFAAVTGAALLLTGILRMASTDGLRDEKSSNFLDALVVGVLQSLAIIPGISRSGSTVFGLVARGFDSESAFRLSFLISVPAVLGAQVGLGLLSGFQVNPMLIVSVMVSAVVGYLAIGFVLKIAERVNIAYLCFILAFLSIVSALL